ncbi:methionine ABC transporter ATP-binding protein [Curvibacter sp. HBC61]|uniref:Methionine ABC transporter ATP-binding protein n=1 Tax=Curvibacter cyanobacteriorum TaxID=3026422 RepID=A0ABT5MVT6_9BURK|nr:methionine ABC transporter ATP-binding protein [Curvibacter sp. HBC61]MDD0838173.1 methionine ABC transporter ATP-binding protein [Curvibacter sp. HBC61]
MIHLEGIYQTYPGPQGPVEALRGIDLRIAAGEVFGIIGRSGAGKSSLVRTINWLNQPSRGTVTVAGRSLGALSEAQLREARRDIGMIFQHFNLLASRTVYDNVALPLELARWSADRIRARVEPLLELVGLSAFRDRYPAQLSGGQKQRVGIARALASQPKVLLSDEATSALDPETTRSILALLRDINRELGLTIVLITHQMQVIKQVADRVAVIDGGRIVECGPVLEVFSRPQHATTRSLIEDVVPQALPEAVLARVQAQLQQSPDASARLLRLVFAGAQGEQALLSDVIRRFNLDLNILHGQVDDVQGQPFGALSVLARGDAAAVAQAVAQWRQAGVVVEELSHV